MRTTREEWAKRVERWAESDLTAAEFARELGINPSTLQYWKWRLKKEAGASRGKGRTRRAGSQRKKRAQALAVPDRKPQFVEVASAELVSRQATERIEVAVDGVVVRVPDGFDAETLRRILVVVGDGSAR